MEIHVGQNLSGQIMNFKHFYYNPITKILNIVEEYGTVLSWFFMSIDETAMVFWSTNTFNSPAYRISTRSYESVRKQQCKTYKLCIYCVDRTKILLFLIIKGKANGRIEKSL